MSDDDDELAAMRSARASRLGAAGLTRTAQRAELERHIAASNAMREEPDMDDADEDADDDLPDAAAECMDDEMRQHFPLSFGMQESQPANLLKAHEATARGRGGGTAAPQPPRAPDGPSAGPSSRGVGGPPVGPPRPQGRGLAAAEEEEEGSGMVGPPRLSAGGAEQEEGMVGPPRPPAGRGEAAQEEEEEEEDPYHLPVTHEVQLAGFERLVSALDVEHTGSRVAAGGHDYMVRIYDFNGMKADMRPFREFEPAEGNPVHAVSWSPSGDALLVVTGSAQPKFYDRDGRAKGECVRGDMYLADLKNTKGHVSGCTGGQWHPTERHTAMTCGDDGTLRIWDTANVEQRIVIKPTGGRPGRVAVTSCRYSADGLLIGAGLMDGGLQLWDARGKFGRSAAVGLVLPPKAQMHAQNKWSYVSGAKQLVRKAHEPQTEITSLAFSADAQLLASRGADDTLKLWDLRAFKSPLHVFDNLPCGWSTTSTLFSPDSGLLVTGTSADRTGAGGAIAFFDVKRAELVRRLAMPGSVVALAWQPRLNQLFAGGGDRKSGRCSVLYDPVVSERGALLPVGRKPRAPAPFDFKAPLVIHTPHALPLFRDANMRKRKKGEEDKVRAAVKRVPDAGMKVAGPGKAGKIGTTGGTLLTQYLLKNAGMLTAPAEEEDVREAILRHEDKKDGKFSAFTKAYAKTQPEPIYAVSEGEDEEEDEEGGGG